MALSRTNLIGTISAGAVGTGSFTTGSATIPAGEFLVVMAYSNSGTTVTATNLTISDSLGNTYTSRITHDATPSSDQAARVWTAPVTNSGSATWTVDGGADSTDTYVVIVLSYSGANTTGLGVTAASTSLGTSGAQSITLSGAPATTSEVVGFFMGDINATLPTQTPGATFTELYNPILSGHAVAEVEVRSGSTSTTVDWANIMDAGGSSLSGSSAIAFEVKAAVAVSEPGFRRRVPPAPIMRQRRR